MINAFIIGDSLSTGNGPGIIMVDYLDAKMHTTVDGKKGRRIYDLYENLPSFVEVAKKNDIVIVFLGTNDRNKNYEVTKNRLLKIKQDMPVPVIMIGPPFFACQDCDAEVADVIRAGREVFGERYVDSREFTYDLIATGRTSDGIHFNTEGAKVFGARLASTILGETLTISAIRKVHTWIKWPIALGIGVVTGWLANRITEY